MEDDKIGEIEPVGEVVSEWEDPVRVIKIKAKYLPAMHRMTENTYFWILCWFNNALRLLQMHYTVSNETHGVFNIRSPGRPNPIALTLVRLDKIVGDEIHVFGLDAAPGTPVLDIKPYTEWDVVLLPPTSHTGSNPGGELFRKHVLAHHGEDCLGLELGLKMAEVAAQRLGPLQAPDLKIIIKGDPCLADVLQGITKARLGNPARLVYTGETEKTEVTWIKNGKGMHMVVRPGLTITEVGQQTGEELFEITDL